jgi:hypothetical protein
MSSRFLVLLSLCAAVFAGAAPASSQEDPRADPAGREPLENRARAILQIKSEAGTCYWRISGDDDLVRLPVQDDRFSSVLLSARFEGDQLHLALAGEHAPLDTTSLGQFDFNIVPDAAPVTVNSFRAVKTREGGWELRALPPHSKVDTLNCCRCGIVAIANLAKLSCCPNKNYCIGCGACGDCCG